MNPMSSSGADADIEVKRAEKELFPQHGITKAVSPLSRHARGLTAAARRLREEMRGSSP
ncbi:hypothetical protein ABZ434_23145 [Streptomyces sp. NPDC005761]|uniref:hypothetical protein n=1 Tax=Streptomyces sp. NPDC005761 TaxID=3157066 RepID=UPI0033E1E3FA